MFNKNILFAEELAKAIQIDPDLQAELKTDPIAAAKKIEQQVRRPLDTDVWIYRLVVVFLGLTILSIIIGVILLFAFNKVINDKTIPTILTAIGSAAIGALSGLLAPSPSSVGK